MALGKYLQAGEAGELHKACGNCGGSIRGWCHPSSVRKPTLIRRQIPRAIQYALYALFHRAHLAIPVSYARLQGSRIQRPACIAARSMETKPTGEKLNKMLAMGQSKPWPRSAGGADRGEKDDASALADYFAPLKERGLTTEQGNGYTVGW